MKVKVVKPVEIDFRYLKAVMYVRYWQDCDYSTDGVNYIDACEEDTEEEGERIKEMIPLVNGDSWDILIDLNEGKVVGWPKGFWLKTHFKVCDEGEYSFLDENKNEIINITKEYDQYYVPDFMALEDSGYGDYVYINIDENGNIEHFEWMKSAIKDYFKELQERD